MRFGINVVIVDNRPDRTITGRADTLQPKTIETLRQMRLADQLLLKGVKVHDMRLWVRGSYGKNTNLLCSHQRLIRPSVGCTAMCSFPAIWSTPSTRTS